LPRCLRGGGSSGAMGRSRESSDKERDDRDRVISWASRHLLPVAPALFLLHKALRRLRAEGGLRLVAPIWAGVLLLLSRSLKVLARQLMGRGRVAPDCPGRLPLIGHLWHVFKIQPIIFDYFAKTYGEVGSTLRVVIGPEWAPAKVMTFTTDPVNVEHFLKTNFDNYGKGQEIRELMGSFLGHGIFCTDGEHWKHQRKVAATIFNRKNFSENMVEIFQVQARRLVSVMRRRPPGQEMEMQELFFSLTLDAFCEIGFGLPWNTLEDSAPSVGERRAFARHFDTAQACMSSRFWLRPWWKVECRLAKLGLMWKRSEEVGLIESLEFMDRVVDEILEERLRQKRSGPVADKDSPSRSPAASPSGRPAREGACSDLLSLFMDGSEDKKFLRDIVINFIIAGRDTTACTLSWLFWRLQSSPDVLARVREEVALEAARQRGEAPSDGEELTFSFATLNRMQYCNACVRETVRLHPSVPMNTKMAFGDDVLPDGTLVCKGDFLCYDPYSTARATEHWGPDAAEWKPERWLTMEKEPSVFMNCAFQAGPRICLGREMAILEIKAVLAQMILSGVEWKVRENFTPTFRFPSIVLAMAEPGLPVTVRFPEPP